MVYWFWSVIQKCQLRIKRHNYIALKHCRGMYPDLIIRSNNNPCSSWPSLSLSLLRSDNPGGTYKHLQGSTVNDASIHHRFNECNFQWGKIISSHLALTLEFTEHEISRYLFNVHGHTKVCGHELAFVHHIIRGNMVWADRPVFLSLFPPLILHLHGENNSHFV